MSKGRQTVSSRQSLFSQSPSEINLSSFFTVPISLNNQWKFVLIHALEGLRERLGTPEKDYYYVEHVLESHILPLTNVAFNKLGTLFVTGSYDNTAKIWDTGSGTVLRSLEGHSGVVFTVAFNNPSDNLVLTGSFDRSARLWDVQDGTELRSLEGHTAEVVCGCFNGQGDLALTGSMDSTALLWDVEAGEDIAQLKGHKEEIVVARFSPNDTRILTAAFDHAILLWDPRTGEETLRLEGHSGEVSQARFDWSGDRVLSASVDGTARIWDLRAGASSLAVLSGHEDGVLDADWSLDGRLIATGGEDGLALIHDAINFATLASLLGHEDEVSQVGFFQVPQV